VIRGYVRDVEARLRPRFGHLRLDQIRRNDFQDFADELLAEGLDPSRVRNILMPARVFFRRAYRRPGNMYFTTTRLHQERAGGVFVDVIRDEAHDTESLHPFKGDVDLGKLEALIAREGEEQIAYVSLAGTVNMAGGQPVSMANVKAVRVLCDRHGIGLFLDATRMVENAWFIQEREEGYAGKSVAEILHEFCSYTDGAWMSAKKDSLVNIGGWLAVNDTDIFEEARNLVVVFEGLHTYGGLAGRDMQALAIGIEESVQDDHVRSRIGQVYYLGELLEAARIPFVRPVGGHAIFLDAQRFYPRLPQDAFPAQTLAAELYLDSGIRSMERGVVSAGRDPKTGGHHYPKLELTRLTIPRRVYTQAHMDVVAESVEAVYGTREQARGLKMTYEPRYLRFFQPRFEPLGVRPVALDDRGAVDAAGERAVGAAALPAEAGRAERVGDLVRGVADEK
jgi:tyrosine phenol-lyase